MKNKFFIAIALILLIIPTLCAAAQKTKNWSYLPYVGRDYPQNVYFGDTYLHTSISLDAFGDGNTTAGPNEAYLWTKGEVMDTTVFGESDQWNLDCPCYLG